MKRTTIAILILLAILLIANQANAHHKPGHNQNLPDQVCNENPSQNHNPHCEVEPDEPVVPEKPVEYRPDPTGCVHGDSMEKDVCDKFDLPETPEVEQPTVVIPPQPLMTEGK